MKNIMKVVNVILCTIALIVITTWTVTALQNTVKIDRVAQSKLIKEFKDSNIPCQNLDVLDSVSEILHWEIINNTLHVYTKKDSIRDERERRNYIKNLEDDE